MKNKNGKTIDNAYYFGDVVDGKPKGVGSVYRYSSSDIGAGAYYTYVDATDLVDVKF